MKWRSLEPSQPGSDTRSLQEQFAERKRLINKYVPPEIQAIHARTIADLKQGGISNRILGIGAQAPDFELPDHYGTPVSSVPLLAKGRLVVCFFRGRWCPFCVGQLEAMNLILPEIQASGASLVAISPQTIQQSFFMADQHKFKFSLLSDAGNRTAQHFGLSYRVPDDQQKVYQRVFVNLPFINGNSNWELPVPATYILATDGKILWTSHSVDYTERPEPSDILRPLSG